jgi:hypothetical protein
MKRLFLVLFFTVAMVSPVNAQSTLALQEKCAEGAKKFFLERINFYGGSWGSFNNEKGWGWNDFTSHYNKKLDKCFILIKNIYSPKDKKEDDPIFYSIELFDVYGGKQYGCFWREQYKNFNWPVTRCEVGNKKCQSKSTSLGLIENEFENLIRPYIEE